MSFTGLHLRQPHRILGAIQKDQFIKVNRAPRALRRVEAPPVMVGFEDERVTRSELFELVRTGADWHERILVRLLKKLSHR